MATTTQRLSIEVELTASDTSPGSCCGGGNAEVQADSEVVTIDGSVVLGYVDCLDDNPVSIPLAGLGASGANLVSVTTYGGEVRMRVSSSHGATQAVPVDPRALIESASVPITSIDVTRVVGSGQTPRVYYRLAKFA